MWKSGNNFCELALSFHVELSGLNASCQTCIARTFTSGAVSAASPYAFYTFFPKTVTEHQLWPRLCTGIETTERGPSLHARSSYLYYTCCGKRQLWQGTSSQGRGVGRSFPKEGNPPKFLLEELELVSYRHKRIMRVFHMQRLRQKSFGVIKIRVAQCRWSVEHGKGHDNEGAKVIGTLWFIHKGDWGIIHSEGNGELRGFCCKEVMQ